MASHPHPHHHHHCNHHHAATCSGLCYSCCTTTPPHQSPPPPPPPPPLSSTDPLLQALASQILLQQSPQPHHPHYSAHLNPNTSHHHHHHLQPQHHKKQQFQQQQGHREDHQTHAIISSLLSRIDALESSLRRLSSSSSSAPYRHHYSTIRDVAARTIQSHFRAFLVRRSRTLRNLKDLALIKSAFITLKSSISDRSYLDPESLSRKAMNLLIELDSIQGGDPIIRDGKRAISRDLVPFMDLIDGVSVQRHEFLTKTVKNVRFVQNKNNNSRVLGSNCRGFGGKDQRDIMEKLSDQVQKRYAKVSENDEEEEVELEGFHQGSDDEQFAEVRNYRKNGGSQIRNGILLKRHGVQSGMKKCVSFAENGNAARIFTSRNGAASSNGFPRSDDQRELVESLCRRVEEIGTFSKEAEDDEETHMESGESDQTSDSEEIPTKNSGAEGNYETSGHYQGQHGNLFFSAPEPVKMEARAELQEERLRKLEERMIGKK